jgi:hypothetical protein
VSPVFGLNHHAWRPVQLSEDHGAGRSEGQSHPSRSDAQQGHRHLLILLESSYVLMAFLARHCPVNSNVLDLLLDESLLETIQHCLVVRKQNQLYVVLEQLHHVFFD